MVVNLAYRFGIPNGMLWFFLDGPARLAVQPVSRLCRFNFSFYYYLYALFFKIKYKMSQINTKILSNFNLQS
jgi:hypothetical protein